TCEFPPLSLPMLFNLLYSNLSLRLPSIFFILIKKRTMLTRLRCLFLTGLMFLLVSVQAQNIPTPKEHFGFNIGDDYQLATFTQTEAYFKKLDQSSDRAKLVEI